MHIEFYVTDIFPAYKKFRKNTLDSQWLNCKSYFLRSFGSKKEFNRLLSLEVSHYVEATNWIEDYFSQHSINQKQEIELVISYLKSFKDRCGARATFLVIIAALVALSLPLLSIFPCAALFIISVPLVLTLLERHYLNEHAFYANDLLVLLEQVKIKLPS